MHAYKNAQHSAVVAIIHHALYKKLYTVNVHLSTKLHTVVWEKFTIGYFHVKIFLW